LDRAEHYQDQTGGSELGKNAKDYPETSGELDCAQKNREPFAQANVFASAGRVSEVIPSARQEHESHHDAQEEKRDISKTIQLQKRHPLLIQPPWTAVSTAIAPATEDAG
jgi:hypothetical protein